MYLTGILVQDEGHAYSLLYRLSITKEAMEEANKGRCRAKPPMGAPYAMVFPYE